jgi:hypothetical protein
MAGRIFAVPLGSLTSLTIADVQPVEPFLIGVPDDPSRNAGRPGPMSHVHMDQIPVAKCLSPVAALLISYSGCD